MNGKLDPKKVTHTAFLDALVGQSVRVDGLLGTTYSASLTKEAVEAIWDRLWNRGLKVLREDEP
jgi:hypothetical protein